MYAGPAWPEAPTFAPAPPVVQVTGPIAGLPVTPSPTTGSSSVLMMPSFTGQPGRKGLGPATVGPPGSPPGLMAYSLVLPSFSCPDCASTASDAVLRLPALNPP